MRGFIFTELIEMVERSHGVDFVDQWLSSCESSCGAAYTAVDSYSAEEMQGVVTRLGEMLETPVSDLYRAYGEHLFEYLARSHEALLADMSHPFDLFKRLDDHVHVEVSKLYVDAEVPRFAWKAPSEDQLVLEYRSSRGLADLAEGLIVGAAKHFGTKVEIKREDLSDGKGQIVDFHLAVEAPRE